MKRDEVYIANIVKCRPPGNRDPQPDEVAACRGFLERQIDLVRPRIVVALGRIAAQTLLGNADPDRPLARPVVRGARCADDGDLPSRRAAAQSEPEASDMGRPAASSRSPARRRRTLSAAGRLARLESENRRLRRALESRSRGRHGTVELRLLGPPGVWMRTGATSSEVGFRVRRSLLLLAFLALAPGRRASREAVSEALWPDTMPERARRGLHPVVSVARRALRDHGAPGAEFVVASGGNYALDPDVGWSIDVDEWKARVAAAETHLAGGDPAAAVTGWQRAWRLYRGALLEGIDVPWAQEPREAMREQHLKLLRRLGDTLTALERGDEAMDVYRALLLEDPLQESAHLALMAAYARQGRRDLVRRQYDRLCTLLRTELGSEPLLRTTLEFHTLMA